MLAHSYQLTTSSRATSSIKRNANDQSKTAISVLHPTSCKQSFQCQSSVSDTELATLLLNEITEMDRRRSGPPPVLNHHLQPPVPTTTHTIAEAHITPIDTGSALTIAHPITQPHLYQLFNYEIYPSWPPLRRNVSADKLLAQRQQMNEFAAATAWMHDDALPEYHTMVKVDSSSGEATGNVHAAEISSIKSGATQSSAAAATTKPGRKRCIRGPRGPYKKRQRANSDTSTTTDYTAATTDSTAATATDNSDKKGSGELRVKEKRHGGGRKKGEVVCNLCGVEFTRPFTLKRHLANMHAESAVCVCGIRFKGEGDRALHVAGGTCGGT